MSEVKDYEKQCEMLTKAFKHLYKAQAVLGEYNEMYLSELKYSDGTFAEQAIQKRKRQSLARSRKRRLSAAQTK